MVQLRTVIVVLCLSLLLGALAVSSDAAGRSITLSVNKNGVNNGGKDSITINWDIQSDTTCSSIKLDITGPGAVTGPTLDCTKKTSSFTWNVPAGQATGIYTATLTFKSNWTGDTYCCSNDFTDSAQVQFKVCPAGRIRFCKYNDANGNGVKDTGESGLANWTFVVKKTNGGTELGRATTGSNGCTAADAIIVPIDPCTSNCVTYYVQEIPPAGETGWCRTFPNNGRVDQEFPIQVCANVLTDVTVLNQRSTFRICKFQDTNGNGKQDTGEPGLSGWTFTVEQPQGTVIGTYTTQTGGCTATIPVPTLDNTGKATVYIRETLQPGWIQTTPGANPTPVTLVCGTNPDVVFGNWQPITITGNKFEDESAVVWACNNIVNDNPANPPGIKNWPVMLYEDKNGNGIIDPEDTKLAETLTDANGKYQFTNVQWRPHFIIKEGTHPAEPVECDPTQIPCNPSLCAVHNSKTWVDQMVSVVAISQYSNPGEDCATPDDIALNLVNNPPTTVGQVFANNDFFNRCPSRLWGQICPDLLKEGVNFKITVERNGLPYETITPCPDCGYYIITCTPEEAEGLRCGIFRLIPSGNINNGCNFTATQYCGGVVNGQTTNIPEGGSYTVDLATCEDVRVDFCVSCAPNERRCGIPVTFTPGGWSEFCDPANPIINGGMVYNKFPIAFKNYTLCGKVYNNELVIGGSKTITFIGKTMSLQRLCMLLGGDCTGCGQIMTTLESPWKLDVSQGGGCLAVETIALVMNVAYNDKRLMPRTPGVDLEDYIVNQGPLKGKTVGQVLSIANAVLAGAPPAKYGVLDCAQLVNIIHSINANYEFTDFNTFTDRGYLTPVPSLSDTPMFPKDPHDFVLNCIK